MSTLSYSNTGTPPVGVPYLGQMVAGVVSKSLSPACGELVSLDDLHLRPRWRRNDIPGQVVSEAQHS